ncbi:MAG: (2Fe-2S)-binding protein [Pseudonocardia sp.]
METAAVDVRAVLADVAGLGPFFAIRTDSAEALDPTWRPMRELYSDPCPLRDRIAHVRRMLGSDDRVAASIAFQGLAALVVSAPFAAAVLHAVVPRLTARTLHWQVSTTGSWPLWCSEPDGELVPGAGAAAEALADALFDEHLAPLVAAVRAEVSIAERLLWGSVASSVAGGKRLVVAQRPTAAQRSAAVAERLLGIGPLAGTGDLLPPEEPDRLWSFRRRSCCLYYRVPGGAPCADCILHPP